MAVPSPPSIEAQIRFLQSPHAHRDHAGQAVQVETIETHMSWVFLVGDRVLKMKKTVRYPFLDFSTLAAREYHCREELRLNSRLAPGIYLGLLALRWQDGALCLQAPPAFSPGGQTLDWLVLMQRLPAARMLDRLITAQAVTPAEIDQLATTLIGFYRSAVPVPMAGPDYLARLQHELAISRDLLSRPPAALPAALPVIDRFADALAQHAALLGKRAIGGRVVDGHGDLRPEHVCMLPQPVVIDCLEFNATLREVDLFDELAFLGLECALAGAPWIGPRLIEACAAALGDRPPPALVPLYTAGRALLRARLAMAHLIEPQPRTPQRWPPMAGRYVERATAALDELNESSRRGCA
jgi:aminoglycoside phosphotransferase family enzyme